MSIFNSPKYSEKGFLNILYSSVGSPRVFCILLELPSFLWFFKFLWVAKAFLEFLERIFRFLKVPQGHLIDRVLKYCSFEILTKVIKEKKDKMVSKLKGKIEVKGKTDLQKMGNIEKQRRDEGFWFQWQETIFCFIDISPIPFIDFLESSISWNGGLKKVEIVIDGFGYSIYILLFSTKMCSKITMYYRR